MTTTNKMKVIKELTGEDPVDMFGGDAKNIVDELSTLCGNPHNNAEPDCGECMAIRLNV